MELKNLTKKPSIIFKSKYNKVSVGQRSAKSRDFYYRNGGYLNYIARPDAIYDFDLTDEEVRILNNLRKGNKSQKALYEKKLSELNVKFKTTGIYSKEGVLDEEGVKNLRKEMRKLDPEQIFWDTVISFSEDFIKNSELYTPEKIEKAVREEIKHFLKDNDMNLEDINYFFTMHTNTENNHIHLGIYEKKPSNYEILRDKNNKPILNKYGKPIKKKAWKKKGVLVNTKDFRANLELNIFKQTQNYEEFNQSKQRVVKLFKDTWQEFDIQPFKEKLSWREAKQVYVDINKSKTSILEKIEMFSNDLKELVTLEFPDIKKIPFKKINYGSKRFLTDSLRNRLDEITLNFIEMNPKLKEEYDNFIIENNKRADDFVEIAAPYEFQDKKNKEEYEGIDISLTNEELLRDEEDWDLDDPIQSIKFKMLKYRNQHIKSISSDGQYQGLLPSFGNKILNKILAQWKTEEYKNKRNANTVSYNMFNPRNYKHKKGFFSKLLTMPDPLKKLLWEARQDAFKTAKNIERDIEKTQWQMYKKMQQEKKQKRFY